jgi:signal transduction histidine kinase
MMLKNLLESCCDVRMAALQLNKDTSLESRYAMNIPLTSLISSTSGQTDHYDTLAPLAAIKEFAMFVGLNVLLIEDQPTLSAPIREVLRASGYASRLYWAEMNSDILVQLSSSPDLIIYVCDPNDPTGVEALNILSILREHSINIPFILVADRYHEFLAIECVKRGAADYMTRDTLNRLGLSVHQALMQREREIEFRQAINELRFSETINRALVDVLPAHIAVLDRDGMIVLVNEAWLSFGYQNRSSSSLAATNVGTNYLDTCRRASQTDDLTAAEALLGIQAVLNGSQAVFSLDYPCNTPQETLWFKMDVIPLGTPDGGVVVSHTNITEHKRAEIVNSTADQIGRELEEERKLRLRYLATLSHDLRAPITVINTSHALLTQYADRLAPDQQERHHRIIDSQLEYLANLVQDIITLDTANEGQLKFTPVPLNIKSFCEQIFEEIQPVTTAKHTLSLVLDDGLGTALLDEHLLRHALANLLTNAVHYSPDGGIIMLTVRQDHDNLSFSVSDQGIGIQPDDLPQLFEAFYRGANVKTIQGTGLGLAIVKSCIETHDGTINVESTLGNGTTFTVSVPYR